MKYLLLALGFFAIILLDAPRLIREGKLREAVVFCVLSAIALATAVLQLMSVNMPNPVKFIRLVTERIIDILGLEPFF